MSETLATLRSLLWPVPRKRLSGEVVVIIGGSRGLGLDLARAFAEQGCRIALCARDKDEVERARHDVSQHGADVFARVCDATDEADVERFMRGVVAYHGGIDVLVTSAATIQVGPFEAMTKLDLEEALTQIFWGTYFPTMAVLPIMRKQGQGRIVHITSIGGKISIPHLLPYSTAKFAATAFSAGVRVAVAKDGIQVTTVVPGLMRTGAQVNAPFKGQRDKEFSWFTAGVTLPLISLSSERAARRIIAAVERGSAECTLTVAMRMAIIAQAIAPGFTSKLLTLQDAMLPEFNGDRRVERGAEIAERAESGLVRALDKLGRRNAEKHHEYPGPKNVARWPRRANERIGRA